MSDLSELKLTSTEERILDLLGQGVSQEVTASAVGVSPSFVSQLISQEAFAAIVAERKFTNLVKHNERDSRYDKLEDLALEKLETLLPLVMRPMELTKILATINGAKRRGTSAPESIIEQQRVVPLVMPTQIINKFTTNINNTVIKAGEQDLVTIQSGVLLKELKSTSEQSEKPNEQPLLTESISAARTAGT